MKVDLYESEWWPVYEVSSSFPKMCTTEIPDELFIRHQATYSEFMAIQQELGKIYAESEK